MTSKQIVHIGMKYFSDNGQEALIGFPITSIDLLPQLRKDGLYPHYLNMGQYELAIWTDNTGIDASFLIVSIEAFMSFEDMDIELLVTES